VTSTFHSLRKIAAFACACALFAACSSDDDSKATATTVAQSVSPSSSPTDVTDAPETSTGTEATESSSSTESTSTEDSSATTDSPATTTADATDELDCAGPAASGDAVSVGFMWPEGGEAINQPAVGEAARATVSYANDCLGGIGGHPIKLDECPEAEDQAAVAACANQFISDGVAAVAVSATALPDDIATPVTQAGIPYTSANGVGAEQLNESVFVWGSGVLGALGGMAAYARDNGLKSVAVVTADELAGQIQPIAQPAFDNAGVELRFVGTPAGTPDITPQIRTALSDDPGALAVIGDETACISFLQAIHDLDVQVPAIVIQTCTGQAVIDAVGEDAVNGKIVIGGAATLADDPEAVLYRGVMAKYAPDTDPNGFATFGYISILSLVRAAEGVTGDVDAATLLTAFARDAEHALPLGSGGTFNCGVTYFSKPVPFVSVCSGATVTGVVADGQLTDAAPVEVASLYGS
jgi:branched-chain amino acid transport system substrate-binding protein